MHHRPAHRRSIVAIAVGLLIAAVCITGPIAVPAGAGPTGAERTYLVLYSQLATPANASTAISDAGGELVAAYPEIGVAVARSTDTTFRSKMLRASGVSGVGATDTAAVHLDDEITAADGSEQAVAPAATTGDNLSGLQWDMDQIRAPEAHDVTPGSSSVLVGDIDTGLDYTHPDLAPNVDFANSASCVGGVANTDPAAWNDDNGHGTHTAGTIAAAANGVGIVGVAPDVRIAGIKAGNTAGFFYPEAVVCAFMWAGSHHMQVTNNSYFADPWLFNCRNDAEQRAIWKAEQRAISYAQQQGVLVVAAEGNENKDLSKRNVDTLSPDDQPPPPPRDVTNACVIVPVEVPGVVGVTADGNLRQKAYYSSYGVGTADLVAPGGDRRFQVTAAAPNGRVLSTYPAALNPGGPLSVTDCSVSPCAVYVYLQGTSMASPHVAGVAALVMSQGVRAPGSVTAILQSTANPIPCPPNPFNPGPPFSFQATCTGGPSYNGFYGHGEVDALSAVS
jgi:subtilisin family serine protease